MKSMLFLFCIQLVNCTPVIHVLWILLPTINYLGMCVVIGTLKSLSREGVNVGG